MSHPISHGNCGRFVYIEPEKIGESYVIARIMQKRNNKYLMNAFFRPSEVLSGKSFNDRMLVASTQSKWYEQSKIVGDCQVLHISQIYDLEKFSQIEDNFYFEQLYDLYAKEIYDLARSNLTRLAEDKVTNLMHFPFIYVEVGHTLDIINGTGWCGICKDYCLPLKPEDNCFECAGCLNRYHFDCFDLNDMLDTNRQLCNMCYNEKKEVGWINSSESNLKLLTTFKDFDISPIDINSLQLEWPFRYFGIHTNEESAIDIDYSIVFPRCSVKVGQSLQVKIPKLQSDTDSSEEVSTIEEEQDLWLIRYGKQLQQQMDDEPQVDRTTLDHLKFSRPDNISVNEISTFVKSTCSRLLGQAKGSCQFQQYLYELLYNNGFDFNKTERECKNISLRYIFNHDSFSNDSIFPLPRPVRWLEDIQFGENGEKLIPLIKERGHVIYKIAESLKLPTKVICQFFAMWKKTDIQREAYDYYLKKYMNTKKFGKNALEPLDVVKPEIEINNIHETDMDESSDGDGESSTGGGQISTPHCDNCYSTNPGTLVPTTIFQGRHSKKRREMFCKSCGAFWLKYASTKAVTKDKKTTNKSQLYESGRRNRRNSNQQQTSFQSVPPRSIIPHVPCGVCLDDIKTDEKGLVTDNSAVRCVSCGIVVHKICYDIPRFIKDDELWKCDVCVKGVNKESCCLCGKIDPQVTACKAFQGNIAHAVCLYTNDSFMFSKVDGIREPILYKDIVDTQDLSCIYCHQSVGWKTCCVMSGCQRWFHSCCATRSNAAFTFFDKSMRFFCSEHMCPMVPYDIHDSITAIKSNKRSTKMIKIQEELRYKRTELGKVTTPKFDRSFTLNLYCDPKIDVYKAASKRTMRKSSAHMKIPEFPSCSCCLGIAYPVLWLDDTWKCIKCVRLNNKKLNK